MSATGLLVPSSKGIPSSVWVLDSGVFHHMSPDASYFTSLSLPHAKHVINADGTLMP